MTESLHGLARPRAPRWDKGQPIWTPRDLAVLTWIAEQYGVRRDHLAVLLGRDAQAETQVPGRVAVTTVNDWVQRWQRAGVMESTRVLAGQPSWVWLTRAGLDHLELEYRLWEPKARSVAHLYAVNHVRLWVEERQPTAHWLSERHLRSGRPMATKQGAAGHQPDAEVLLGDNRVAIEVERSAKTPQRLPAILYGLARRYDGIWYFCPSATQALMQRAIAELSPPCVRQKFSIVPLRLEGQQGHRPPVAPYPPPPTRPD